jgi:predicted RNase H-like HicB family nuclease
VPPKRKARAPANRGPAMSGNVEPSYFRPAAPPLKSSYDSAMKSARRSFLLPLTIRKVGPSTYLARCSALPGFLVEAGSVEEVVKLAPKVARALVAAMRDKGVPLPSSMRFPRAPKSVRLLVAA